MQFEESKYMYLGLMLAKNHWSYWKFNFCQIFKYVGSYHKNLRKNHEFFIKQIYHWISVEQCHHIN